MNLGELSDEIKLARQALDEAESNKNITQEELDQINSQYNKVLNEYVNAVKETLREFHNAKRDSP